MGFFELLYLYESQFTAMRNKLQFEIYSGGARTAVANSLLLVLFDN